MRRCPPRVIAVKRAEMPVKQSPARANCPVAGCISRVRCVCRAPTGDSGARARASQGLAGASGRLVAKSCCGRDASRRAAGVCVRRGRINLRRTGRRLGEDLASLARDVQSRGSSAESRERTEDSRRCPGAGGRRAHAGRRRAHAGRQYARAGRCDVPSDSLVDRGGRQQPCAVLEEFATPAANRVDWAACGYSPVHRECICEEDDGSCFGGIDTRVHGRLTVDRGRRVPDADRLPLDDVEQSLRRLGG